jgi:hypothetical protein
VARVAPLVNQAKGRGMNGANDGIRGSQPPIRTPVHIAEETVHLLMRDEGRIGPVNLEAFESQS